MIRQTPPDKMALFITQTLEQNEWSLYCRADGWCVYKGRRLLQKHRSMAKAVLRAVIEQEREHRKLLREFMGDPPLTEVPENAVSG